MRNSSRYSKTNMVSKKGLIVWCALVVALLNLGAASIQAQSSWGLKARNNQFWQQGRNGLGGNPEGMFEEEDGQGVNYFLRMGDRFGQAVASADFNGDGYMDLAVGAPDENSPVAERFVQGKGTVTIIYGTGNGLNSFRTQMLNQGEDGIQGTRDVRDRFGAALAVGDFNGDGYADLAIGAPGENAPTTTLTSVSDVTGGSVPIEITSR